jgi:hypothetical protein
VAFYAMLFIRQRLSVRKSTRLVYHLIEPVFKPA